MKKYVEQSLKKLKEGYLLDQNRIISDYRKECESLQDYRGREILELIQNADDELNENFKKEIYISFIDDLLTVCNNGDPFSKDGIISLMYSNVSGKRSRKKQVIGNKGTGFRSILGWAEYVMIDSGDLHIRFSEKHSNSVLEELFQGTGIDISDKRAATLVFPEWMDDYQENEYTTRISIKTKEYDNTRSKILEQLYNLDTKILLFLNNTESLVIETEERQVKFIKEIMENGEVLLKHYVNEKEIGHSIWSLNVREGKIDDQYFSIIMAYNKNGLSSNDYRLYCYFPTDTVFPFPILTHANFNLTADRNHLIKDDNYNEIIIDNMIDFLVETAIKLSGDEISYKPLKFLIPEMGYSKDLISYGIQKKLKEKIQNTKLFPLCSGEYSAFHDKLLFFDNGLTKYLRGHNFKNVLIECYDYKVRKLIQSDKYLGEKQDMNIIEAFLPKVGKWVKETEATDEHIKITAYTLLKIIEYFGNMNHFNRYNVDYWNKKLRFPSMLFNTERKLISATTEAFVMNEKVKCPKLPPDTDINFIHPLMIDAMALYYNNKASSMLSTLKQRYTICDAGYTEIINYLNSNIENKKAPSLLGEKKRLWNDFILWLWSIKDELKKTGNYFNICFLNEDERFIKSCEGITGLSYGNEFAERLFAEVYSDKMIYNLHDIIEASTEELNNFVKLFNVKEYPSVRAREVIIDESYARKIFGDFKFPYKLKGEKTFESFPELYRYISGMWGTVDTIDRLEDILKRASTSDILLWLNKDTHLFNLVSKRYELNDGKVEILWGKKKNRRPIESLSHPYSYIRHLFETIPWIKVGNKNYRINQCLLRRDSSFCMDGIIAVPNLDGYVKKAINKKELKKIFRNILAAIGVKEDLSKLPVNTIYTILLKLPEQDPKGMMAKKIYGMLVTGYSVSEDDLVNSVAYNNYLEKGFVYCQDGYHPINKSYYLDGKDVCKQISDAYNLICLPKRRNREAVKKYLGVDHLNLNVALFGKPQICSFNNDFLKDFYYYKTLALIFRMNSKNNMEEEASKFRRLTISLCDKVCVENDGLTASLEDYEFIMEEGFRYYLKVPAEMNASNLANNILLSASIAEILCSYLDVKEPLSKFRELYLYGSKERREWLINQEYDDLSMIEKAKELMDYKEDIREECYKTIQLISSVDIKKIRPLVDSIDFYDFMNPANITKIIDLMMLCGTDIEDYNAKKPSVLFDLTSYYRQKIYDLMPIYKEKYRQKLYIELKDASIEQKMEFMNKMQAYDNCVISIQNSIYFNCASAIMNHFKLDDNIEDINLNSIFRANMDFFLSKINCDSDMEAFFNNPENTSLLYFGEFDKLIKLHELFLSRIDKEIIVQEKNVKNDETTIKELCLIESDIKPGVLKKSNNQTKLGYQDKRDKEKKMNSKTGRFGEKLVFQYLSSDPSIKAVFWVSENAKKENVNPEGSAGYGYDMEYIDVDGKRHYVEVKTSKAKLCNGIRFFLSDNEFEFGANHSDYYHIYYVSDIDSDTPSVTIFDQIFADNKLDSSRFAVNISKEYIVTAQTDTY